MIDETLKNNNRREHELVNHLISAILPTHFVETYPTLTRFLQLYYLNMHQEGMPTEFIHSLFETADITAIDSRFLKYMEEQFLLGNTSFKGLDNSRLALKLSNNLFKTKGSKYSLEQFFRIFFGVDAEVVYTKNNVFILNESQIGSESFRYITDDKLYQVFAILIKTGAAVSEWMDLYKQFVHPAGLYVQGQTVVTSVARLFGPAFALPVSRFDSEARLVVLPSLATWGRPIPYVDVTGIIPGVGVDSYHRIGLNNTIELYQAMQLEDLDKQYNNIREIMTSNSPTFDMDATMADSATIRMSNTIETMDQNLYVFYPDSV